MSKQHKQTQWMLTEENPFIVGVSNLEQLLDRPRRLNGGCIMLCSSGEAEIVINMKSCRVVKDMQIILLPNDLLMLTGKSDHFRLRFITFSEALFEEACYRISSDLFGFLRDNYTVKLPAETIPFHEYFYHVVEHLYKDVENRFRTRIVVNNIQNYFLNSCDKIFRYHSLKEIKEADRQNDLFKRFITLVHTNCTRSREVTFYANMLSISTRYLSAVVKKHKQSSAKAFIDNAVIQEIKLLLHTTDLSIQEIADRFNFPDQSNLGRFFKKQTGISPREYRKQH